MKRLSEELLICQVINDASGRISDFDYGVCVSRAIS